MTKNTVDFAFYNVRNIATNMIDSNPLIRGISPLIILWFGWLVDDFRSAIATKLRIKGRDKIRKSGLANQSVIFALSLISANFAKIRNSNEIMTNILQKVLTIFCRKMLPKQEIRQMTNKNIWIENVLSGNCLHWLVENSKLNLYNWKKTLTITEIILCLPNKECLIFI